GLHARGDGAERSRLELHLDLRRLQTLADGRSQPAGVEGVLLHFVDSLDQVVVEERAHFARRGREPRANPAAELLELTGGDLTLSPRHGVVMAERPVDALRVVRGEPGVVHARAQPREDAAGIVVAAVDARLVVRG